MRKILLALVALLATGPAVGAPLNFKGIPLGITLEQFRATPHPDGRRAKVQCTGDAHDNLAVDTLDVEVTDKVEQSVGAIHCVFWSLEPLYSGGPTGTLGLDIGDSGTIRYVFKFVPDKAGVKRLYKIEVIAPPDALNGIIDPLTARFGPPEVSSTPVQNLAGATFERKILVWHRDGAVLTVRSPADVVHQMSLIYVDEALSELVETARKQDQAARPNRI